MEKKRRLELRHSSWIYRYPKAFQITFVSLGLGIFFSKPIYDFFIADWGEFDLTEPPTTLTYYNPDSATGSNEEAKD